MSGVVLVMHILTLALFGLALASSGEMVNAVGHGGSLFGSATLCTRLVDDRYLIVLFCNTGIGQRMLIKMTMDIAKILHDHSYSK